MGLKDAARQQANRSVEEHARDMQFKLQKLMNEVLGEHAAPARFYRRSGTAVTVAEAEGLWFAEQLNRLCVVVVPQPGRHTFLEPVPDLATLGRLLSRTPNTLEAALGLLTQAGEQKLVEVPALGWDDIGPSAVSMSGPVQEWDDV